MFGQEGIFTKAKTAVGKYKQAQDDEQAMINDVSNYINGEYITAHRDTVTISAEEYAELQRGNLYGKKRKQLIKFEKNLDSIAYTNDPITYPMSSFIETKNNEIISNYLNYNQSTQKYEVLKSGWYFIQMEIGGGSHEEGYASLRLMLGDELLMRAFICCIGDSNGDYQRDSNATMYYFNEGDELNVEGRDSWGILDLRNSNEFVALCI